MNATAALERQSNRVAIITELTAVEAELQRRRWKKDPATWAREKLHDELWSGQERIMRAVAKYRRVAVQTCHQIGKSFAAGVLAAWWVDTRWPGDAFVVTTAPTNPQVRVILWKEIGRAHTRGKLVGRVNQTEWKIAAGGKEETAAIGRKPNDYAPAAFQGIHARYVLVIVDEANGVRGPLWESLESLVANNNGKILAIGNPDDPSGEFFNACKPGSGWDVIQIGAFDSPNFTREPVSKSLTQQLIGRDYVEERRRKWANGWTWSDDGSRCIPPDDATRAAANPYWHSKVLGQFPDHADAGGLIPIAWIKAAQLRELTPSDPNELGVDVGAGGDATSVCQRRGSVYRIIRTDHDRDTMSQCGKIIADLRATGATSAKIDKIGVGWGLVNRGEELGEPFIGVNVSESAMIEPSSDDRFANKRAELWWYVRGLFERGEIDIDAEDEELAAELCSVRYKRLSSGKIQIESKRKDEYGHSIASPNRADSLMLAAAPIERDDIGITI